MFKSVHKLFKASDLREYIKTKNLNAFNTNRKHIFFNVLKLIKNSAESGFSNCQLSYKFNIAYGGTNRMYVEKEYIPLFFDHYEQEFLDCGYDIYRLGDHSIVISWRSDKNESENDL